MSVSGILLARNASNFCDSHWLSLYTSESAIAGHGESTWLCI